jgi:hypothetical protein
MAPAPAWRLFSHNVWGVGGPLPLTTPALACQSLHQHHLTNPPPQSSSSSSTTEPPPFIVVCLQEAFTSRVSLPSYALTWLLCMPSEWLLNAAKPAAAPTHLLLWPARAIYLIPAAIHAIVTHSVMIGPAITCYPRSLARYVALALAVCLAVSALLTLLLALPYHLLCAHAGGSGGVGSGGASDSLAGENTTTTSASPALSAALVHFYWRCLAFWLGLSVRAHCLRLVAVTSQVALFNAG